MVPVLLRLMVPVPPRMLEELPRVIVALWGAAEASIHVSVTVWPTWKPSMAVWRSDVFEIVWPPTLVMRPQAVTPALAAGFDVMRCTQAPAVARDVVQLTPVPSGATTGTLGETATPSSAARPM